MNIAYELESLVSLLNFVAMGAGCGVLPEYMRLLPRRGVVFKKLRAPYLVKTLTIVKKKDRGGLADSFYKFTVKHMATAAKVLAS